MGAWVDGAIGCYGNHHNTLCSFQPVSFPEKAIGCAGRITKPKCLQDRTSVLRGYTGHQEPQRVPFPAQADRT